MMPGSSGRWLSLTATAAAIAAIGGWLDARYGWITPVFDAIAHQFYEVPLVARVRRPSQLILVRWHLAIASGLVVLSLLARPWLGRHARAWLAVFVLGYALRATIWICGGNLPLVPGDSCHYLEVATSVLRGEGPVKHYVESFFTDYPRIREGRGVLDDWATPLDAYVRAFCFRVAGLGANSAWTRGSPRPKRAASYSISWPCRLFTSSLAAATARASRSGPWPCSPSCRSTRSTPDSSCGRAS